jgi:hypothetical protein
MYSGVVVGTEVVRAGCVRVELLVTARTAIDEFAK